MTPPTMAGWNLALRFGLELTSLVGFGAAAWTQTSGGFRWIAAAIAPLLAATVWGVFNVKDDPSRSGNAPIEVPGWVRLATELAVLGGGTLAIVAAGRPRIAITLAVLIAVHVAVSAPRVRWLLTR